MFGFLKKKIQGLIEKTKEEVIEKQVVEILEKSEETKKGKPQEKVKEKKPEEKDEEAESKKERIEENLKKLDEEEKEQKIEEKEKGFFSRLAKGFTNMKLSEDAFNEFFTELEEILIENNVALGAVDALKIKLKKDLIGKDMKKSEVEEKIKEALKEAVSSLMSDPFDLEEKIKSSLKSKRPFVMVFFGINGSGKTTTISKLAWKLKKKFSVILAAADTFRAASIEQLEKHGSNLKLEVVKSRYGADPASIIFDAIVHAKVKGTDIVLADTAGRMHTKTDLLREMEKIVRVAKPDLKIFVAESITGNDAIEQAKAFDDAVGIDAIILTKADVDERGGACLSVSYITGKPILFLGMGQEYESLEVFDKKKILDKLFG
ncbi:MAG: signal recognition particle-docking protein FtsY [Candidatus Pacearchaeota archaeon]|nr:signal recognition particle-docking protein FtsY [Candidatus Pacearchaeota archaeon]